MIDNFSPGKIDSWQSTILVGEKFVLTQSLREPIHQEGIAMTKCKFDCLVGIIDFDTKQPTCPD